MDEITEIDMDLASLATIETTKDANNGDNQIDDDLLESIGSELGGTVAWESIKLAIVEAEAKYEHARVKSFLPILMRRYVLKTLRSKQAKTQEPSK